MDLLLSNGLDCAPTSSCMEYCLASLLLLSLLIEELDLDQFAAWTSPHVCPYHRTIVYYCNILFILCNKESIAKDNLQQTDDIFSLSNCDHRFCPINNFSSLIVSSTFS
jgi:hypothetical protein